ncbi:MAG: hypothetical protein COB35_08400 [Gammaproteobacteria bacterium]|nr:MAG: hypothetical protein COB35_08400 [Gammaproteobacteria bacterium]
MKNISSYIILLFLILNTSFALAKAKDQQTKTSAKSTSIAKPNWWKKSSGISTDLSKKANSSPNSMSATQINTMRTEPITHFLDFTADKNWQLISNNIGMASAKYQITLSGKQYELAIIRMNNNIPLDSVLNIWQNKVGLMAQSRNKPVPVQTKKGQTLNLITIEGDQKAILVAFHKQQKYTFFRLFAKQGLNQEIRANFMNFLTNLYVKN